MSGETKGPVRASDALRACAAEAMHEDIYWNRRRLRNVLAGHIAAAERAEAEAEERDGESVYDPGFGDRRECVCGHPYYRHFDSWDDMAPVGCKYCECYRFKERDGESVEALMRECAHMEPSGRTVTLVRDLRCGSFGAWVGPDELALHATCSVSGPLFDPIDALLALRDKLRAASSPPAPDYEKMSMAEMVAHLPKGTKCGVDVQGGFWIFNWPGVTFTREARYSTNTNPLLEDAVRAYLREHGGGAA